MAIPIANKTEVYSNIENTLHLELSVEQKSNATVCTIWCAMALLGFRGVDSRRGCAVHWRGRFLFAHRSGWERRVTSEFGNRIDPIASLNNFKVRSVCK